MVAGEDKGSVGKWFSGKDSGAARSNWELSADNELSGDDKSVCFNCDGSVQFVQFLLILLTVQVV